MEFLIPVIIIVLFLIFILIITSSKMKSRMLEKNLETLNKFTKNSMPNLKDLSKTVIDAKKSILEENYDDLKEIEELESDIESVGIKKKTRAFKEGLTEGSAFCKHCGKSIDKDSTYCKYCGKEL